MEVEDRGRVREVRAGLRGDQSRSSERGASPMRRGQFEGGRDFSDGDGYCVVCWASE
jgi:hypothetical protein